jgi:sulfite dehydrogenase (quinone) subunit SoeC
MNPAYSVILFTTASGAGYGLLALIAMAGASHGRASTSAFAYTTLFIALSLITTGLLSSTLHLGRPEHFRNGDPRGYPAKASQRSLRIHWH